MWGRIEISSIWKRRFQLPKRGRFEIAIVNLA